MRGAVPGWFDVSATCHDQSIEAENCLMVVSIWGKDHY
jgi:hypothetical protein